MEESKNQADNKKEEPFYKKDWFKTILITLTTTVFTQLLTYFFWTRQFQNNKEQKLLEYKIASFDKFSATTGKAIYLSEFTTRYKIEQFVEEQKIRDSIYKKSGIIIDTLNANIKYEISKKLKINYPLYYDNYMNFLDYQNEYNSTAFTASLQFGDKVAQDISILSRSFVEDELVNNIKKELQTKDLNVYNFDKDKLINSMLKQKYAMFQDLLNEMMNDIKKE